MEKDGASGSLEDGAAKIQDDISQLTLGQISEKFVRGIGNRGAQKKGQEFLKEIVQSLVDNANRVESALKISSGCKTSESGSVTFQVTETEPPLVSEGHGVNDQEEKEIESPKNSVQGSGENKISTNYPDDTEFIQLSNCRVLKPSNSPVFFNWDEFVEDSLKLPSSKSNGHENKPPTATPAPKVTSGHPRKPVKEHVAGDPSRKTRAKNQDKKGNLQKCGSKRRGRPTKQYDEFPDIEAARVLDRSEEKVVKLEKYLKMATKRTEKENTTISTCSFPVAPTNGELSTPCGSNFPNIYELKRHLSRKHLEMERWICKQCVNKQGENLHYKAKNALVSHLQTHHSDFLKTCECGWSSKSYRSFLNHAKKCEKNPKGNPKLKKNRNGKRRNIKD